MILHFIKLDDGMTAVSALLPDQSALRVVLHCILAEPGACRFGQKYTAILMCAQESLETLYGKQVTRKGKEKLLA